MQSLTRNPVADDILITKDGFENLTDVPKTVDEIEALLA